MSDPDDDRDWFLPWRWPKEAWVLIVLLDIVVIYAFAWIVPDYWLFQTLQDVSSFLP